MKLLAGAGACLLLTACVSTPYQEMGFSGGVDATQISFDTFQITARGNAYTDPDTIQRYALRKAAEQTVAAGFDYFIVGDDRDRSATGETRQGFVTGDFKSASLFAISSNWIKPGQTLLVRMTKGPAPDPMPMNMFNAREVLKYLTTGSYVPPAPNQ